jgi:hypothetical protein
LWEAEKDKYPLPPKFEDSKLMVRVKILLRPFTKTYNDIWVGDAFFLP